MVSTIDAFRRERIRRRRIAVLTDDAYPQCGFYCKQFMFLESRSPFTLINIYITSIKTMGCNSWGVSGCLLVMTGRVAGSVLGQSRV